MPTIAAHPETLDALRQAWLAACLAFDEAEAEQALSSAFALYPVETVCFEILLHSLAAVGERWYRGEITVQQEHFVSELSVRRVEAVLSALPRPSRAGRIAVGCAPEDSHSFAPLLLALLLRQRGWEVIYLGARVPADRLAQMVADSKPHLVILTAQLLSSAETLLDVADALQVAQVPFAFGGRIFNLLPRLRTRIAGHFLGERIETAPAVVEQLLTSRSMPTRALDVPDSHQQALHVFRERRSLLEAEIWNRLVASDIQPAHLEIANAALAGNISAALRFGDMGFLHTDIAWIAGLLEMHRIPRRLLHEYLKTYRAIAQAVLGEPGAPVLDWLERLDVHEAQESE
jgi:methanogenic corrinoid protein MtbC1